MSERTKILHIYGDELLEEEFKAAKGILRMIDYQKQISKVDLNDSVSSASVIEQDSSSVDKVLLPPFVRAPLEEIRDAKSPEGN